MSCRFAHLTLLPTIPCSAYNIEGGGSGLPTRTSFNSDVETRSFWEHYTLAFHDCASTARGMHVMASYNSMNGVPTAADSNLLDGILREQWDWPGFVVGDYDAYANIYATHHYVPDMEHAAAVGLNAGLDQEGGGTIAISKLQSAIAHGLTNASAVHTAFRRLMRVRMLLGMFDPPSLNRYYKLGEADLQTDASTALNRLAAAKGMVLHKNGQHDGRMLLPLSAKTFKGVSGSMLVAGPVANNGNNTFGNYGAVRPLAD